MLRKDVKLGFAIGGIMLAVVVVYVLVVPGGDKKTVSVVPDDSQGSSQATPSPAPTDAKVGDTKAGDAKAAEPEIANGNNAPPADPTKADSTATPTTLPSAAASDATGNAPSNAAGRASDWNKLLAEGSSSPTMMSQTPSLDTKHGDEASPAGADAADKPAADPSNAPAAGDATSTPPTPAQVADAVRADKTTPDLGIDTSGTPATQPNESAERTHTVQPGEMLTSIAASVYGDSHKWKKIAAANPTINPNRLAPGTKLIIPALKGSAKASAIGGSSQSTAQTAAAALDPQKQYEVQPSDSLYRISMKLYGNASHVDKLYADNKETIGSDPRRLKLNMVLKLSDPPTSTLTNTASR
jgi:nucleoid-associated protein YgaU